MVDLLEKLDRLQSVPDSSTYLPCGGTTPWGLHMLLSTNETLSGQIGMGLVWCKLKSAISKALDVFCFTTNQRLFDWKQKLCIAYRHWTFTATMVFFCLFSGISKYSCMWSFLFTVVKIFLQRASLLEFCKLSLVFS